MGRPLPRRTDSSLAGIGTVNQPAVGYVSCVATKDNNAIRLDFTLSKARISVTDAAGSGSYGSLKLFDFVEGVVSFLGARQDYTAFVEGSALTTAAGDAVHVLGVGTAAIATARDGTLTGTENDVGTKTGSITNSSGTGAGTQVDGAKTTALNGTATAIDLYLNWSGTAATIDASSTIGVTGTISVLFAFVGDD